MKHLCLLCCLLSMAFSLGAEELPHDARLLAATRAAHVVYQRHLAALQQQLSAEDPELRRQAIRLLAETNDRAVVPHLRPFLDRDVHSQALVEEAILALTYLGADIATDLRLLAQGHPDLNEAAYNGLARLQRWGGDDWLRRSDDEDAGLRASAVIHLGENNIQGAGDILAAALLGDDRPHIRRMAALALGRLRDPGYTRHLTRALSDPNPRVRRYAAEALTALRATEAIPHILMAMQSNVAGLHMNRALMAISGQDFNFDHRAPGHQRQQAIDEAFSWYSSQSDNW